MRRLLFMLVGLLATVGCIVALVNAQDLRQSSRASGASRGPARPSSRLADRLKAVRESVVTEYATAPPVEVDQGAAPAAMRQAAEAPADVLADPAPGLPSVLKRPGGSSPAPASERLASPVVQPHSGGPMDGDEEPAPLNIEQTEAGALMPQPAESMPAVQPEVSFNPSPAYTLPDSDQLPSGEPTEAIPSNEPVEQPLRSPAPIYDAPQGSKSYQISEPAGAGAPLDTAPLRDNTVRSLLSGQLPILHLETIGPPSIVVGREASYQVQVTNQSSETARDLYVRITLPPSVRLAQSGASLGAARWQSEGADAGRLLWSIPELAAGGDALLTIGLVAQDDSPVELNVEWTFKPASSTAQIAVLQPQLEMIVNGPKEITYGSAADYTITVSNPGTGDAENVVLTLASAGQAPETKSLGTIPAGERRQVSLTLAARQAGALELKALATAEPAVRAEVLEQILVRRANLKLHIEGPRVRYAGATANYQIVVENTGDADAQDLLVQVNLPEGARYLAEQESEAGALSWPIGVLGPGQRRNIEVACQLQAPGENRLEVQAAAAAGVAASQTVATHVEALADLKLAVNDPKGPVPIGENVVYEVHVLNRGSKAAHHVTVLAQFSQGIEPVAAEGLAADIVPGQVLFHALDHLPPGETKVLKITARADDDGAHRFRVEVKCIDPETRLVSEETTRFFRQRKD